MSDEQVEMHCSDCGTTQAFVSVPCEDGHGLDCPDLACIVCGLAVTRFGLLLTEDVVFVSAA